MSLYIECYVDTDGTKTVLDDASYAFLAKYCEDNCECVGRDAFGATVYGMDRDAFRGLYERCVAVLHDPSLAHAYFHGDVDCDDDYLDDIWRFVRFARREVLPLYETNASRRIILFALSY